MAMNNNVYPQANGGSVQPLYNISLGSPMTNPVPVNSADAPTGHVPQVQMGQAVFDLPQTVDPATNYTAPQVVQVDYGSEELLQRRADAGNGNFEKNRHWRNGFLCSVAGLPALAGCLVSPFLCCLARAERNQALASSSAEQQKRLATVRRRVKFALVAAVLSTILSLGTTIWFGTGVVHLKSDEFRWELDGEFEGYGIGAGAEESVVMEAPEEMEEISEEEHREEEDSREPILFKQLSLQKLDSNDSIISTKFMKKFWQRGDAGYFLDIDSLESEHRYVVDVFDPTKKGPKEESALERSLRRKSRKSKKGRKGKKAAKVAGDEEMKEKKEKPEKKEKKEDGEMTESKRKGRKGSKKRGSKKNGPKENMESTTTGVPTTNTDSSVAVGSVDTIAPVIPVESIDPTLTRSLRRKSRKGKKSGSAKSSEASESEETKPAREGESEKMVREDKPEKESIDGAQKPKKSGKKGRKDRKSSRQVSSLRALMKSVDEKQGDDRDIEEDAIFSMDEETESKSKKSHKGGKHHGGKKSTKGGDDLEKKSADRDEHEKHAKSGFEGSQKSFEFSADEDELHDYVTEMKAKRSSDDEASHHEGHKSHGKRGRKQKQFKVNDAVNFIVPPTQHNHPVFHSLRILAPIHATRFHFDEEMSAFAISHHGGPKHHEGPHHEEESAEEMPEEREEPKKLYLGVNSKTEGEQLVLVDEMDENAEKKILTFKQTEIRPHPQFINILGFVWSFCTFVGMVVISKNLWKQKRDVDVRGSGITPCESPRDVETGHAAPRFVGSGPSGVRQSTVDALNRAAQGGVPQHYAPQKESVNSQNVVQGAVMQPKAAANPIVYVASTDAPVANNSPIFIPVQVEQSAFTQGPAV
jgi:hypothetical protein